MHLLFLTLGLWRCWLGRGIGDGFPVAKGLTYVQYAAALLLVYIATWADPWQITLVDAIGVLALARIYGHTPMEGWPLKADPDDFILKIVGGPGGGYARYLAYAGIRYMIPAVVWGCALVLVGGSFHAPIIGTAWIIAWYVILARVGKHDFFGMQWPNWSQLIGWTGLGLALATLR